jgi:hypothetical protein
MELLHSDFLVRDQEGMREERALSAASPGGNLKCSYPRRYYATNRDSVTEPEGDTRERPHSRALRRRFAFGSAAGVDAGRRSAAEAIPRWLRGLQRTTSHIHRLHRFDESMGVSLAANARQPQFAGI